MAKSKEKLLSLFYLSQPRWPNWHRILTKPSLTIYIFTATKKKILCACNLKALCRGLMKLIFLLLCALRSRVLVECLFRQHKQVQRVHFLALIWEGQFPVVHRLLLLCINVRKHHLLINFMYLNIGNWCFSVIFLICTLDSSVMLTHQRFQKNY